MTIAIGDFEQVVFFTGAGISAESGVPTYRGKGGIWKEYDYQSCACQDAFDRDAERVWEFHNYRRGLVAACEPNLGHQLIARAEASHPSVWVITQNIDGLHQRAGSRNVIEMHGSLWRVRCDACGTKRQAMDVPFNERRCTCGQGLWRPDITWFGDALDSDMLSEVQQRVSSCTLFVSVGTSGVVYPAALVPKVAKQAGALLVEINLERTDASDLYDFAYLQSASQGLAQLIPQD